jgi:Putative cyclase
MIWVKNSTGSLLRSPSRCVFTSEIESRGSLNAHEVVLVAAFCFVFTSSARAQDVSGGQWIDLTHPFNAETVYWPTAKTFEKETVFAGRTDYYYTAYNFAAAEHGGTHLDAPIHFAEGALTADQLPVSQLIGPGVVVDVTQQAAEDVDDLVMPSDIEAHERAHGRIPEGAIVLINTAAPVCTPIERNTWAQPSAARKP